MKTNRPMLEHDDGMAYGRRPISYDERPISGGFRKTPNGFFDVYMPLMEKRCSGAWVVFMFLWRQTIGFNRHEATITIRQIAAGTGLGRWRAHHAVQWLLEFEFVAATPTTIRFGRGHGLLADTSIYRVAAPILAHVYRGLVVDVDGDEWKQPDGPYLSQKLRDAMAADLEKDASNRVRSPATRGLPPDTVGEKTGT